MDWNVLREKGSQFLSKYKFVLLVLFAGILLMSIPSGESHESENTTPAQDCTSEDPAEELEEILSQIEGVGRVQVLLTEASGPETVYQTDEDHSSDGSVRVDTVIISNENRGESGLVQTVTPPTYLGAIIVCEGAERPTVRLSIVQAVSNVTGISTDRITVLKMK